MNETADICLTVTDGPVIIRGLGSAAVDATHTLWDCIVASERFPSGAGASGASYVVTLKKGVDQASEVRRAEDDLTKALLMLAAAWPFSGGSYLTIETREVVCSPRFESNAAELERRMLEQCGIAKVASTASVPLSWCATYSQPPLCLAVRIARLMHSDFHTRRVLLYHQRSVTERAHRSAFEGASWFISLYKVRDFLCKLYGSDRTAKLTQTSSGGTLGKY